MVRGVPPPVAVIPPLDPGTVVALPLGLAVLGALLPVREVDRGVSAAIDDVRARNYELKAATVGSEVLGLEVYSQTIIGGHGPD